MFQNIPREKVLEVVKAKGPLIPVRIVKELGGNTFIVGAVLSDLMASKLVKATLHLRVGSTPVYYVSGQEEKLLDFLNYLNEKDRRAVQLLKESSVLEDSVQDPLMRVCLQNCRDFAVPFQIDDARPQGQPGQKALFYRFMLVPEGEAVSLARQALHAAVLMASSAQRPSAPAFVPAVEQPVHAHEVSAQAPAPQPAQPLHVVQSPATPVVYAQSVPAPDGQTMVGEFIAQKPQRPKNPDHFARKVQEAEAAIAAGKPIPSAQGPQASAASAPQAKEQPRPPPGSYAEKVFAFLAGKGITVEEVLLVKKGEVSCVVNVPSPVGSIMQYCKAREKKSVSDGDLATAILEAQTKGLSLLYIAQGVPSKKAQSPIDTSRKSLSFVRI